MPNIGVGEDYNQEIDNILQNIRARQADVRNAARELRHDIEGAERARAGQGEIPVDADAPPVEAARPRVQIKRKEYDAKQFWYSYTTDKIEEKSKKTSAAKLKELKNKVDGLQLTLYQLNKNLLDVPSFARAVNKQLRRHKTVKFRLKTQVTQRELAAQIAEILWLASKDVDQAEVL